jgi:CDP-paratose 2-epimerase
MSSVVVVTGSAGLIGSESVRHFAGLGMDVVGVDNDMRGYFFGKDGSTKWNLDRLRKEVGERYTHHDVDIRDRDGLLKLFAALGKNGRPGHPLRRRSRRTTGPPASRSPTST